MKSKKMKIFGSKRSVLIAALVLLLVVAVGVTVALLIDSTNGLENEFTPSHVDCEVEEVVKDGVKESVQIKNICDTDAYIRVAVIANSVDEDGNITGAADVSSALAADGWVKRGDYWYWTEVVKAKDGLTGELLLEGINLKGKQVTILADAVQSAPAKAVGEAWGVVIAEDSVTAYSAE